MDENEFIRMKFPFKVTFNINEAPRWNTKLASLVHCGSSSELLLIVRGKFGDHEVVLDTWAADAIFIAINKDRE